MFFARLLPFAALALVAAPLQAQPVRPFSLAALKAAQAACRRLRAVVLDVPRAGTDDRQACDRPGA